MVDDHQTEDAETPHPTEFETACSRKLKDWIVNADTFPRPLSASSDDSRERIESMWKTWVVQVNEAGRESVGEKIISGKSRSFFDNEAREAVKVRRELFEAAVANPSSHAWKVYLAKCKEVSKMIYAKKKDGLGKIQPGDQYLQQG